MVLTYFHIWAPGQSGQYNIYVIYYKRSEWKGSRMVNKKATRYEEFEAELLRKPGIRKEFEALQPRYDMIRSLIERRNQLQITQKQLADIVGTKQPAISRLEKGDYNTTLSTLFKVADALDLDISLRAR
ncbi:MAG: helix-turn-helix domain-containing protein, partial [Chloroflexi bacterium]|nr:helix-turn-helix domain-containing protein [Chloroflexota bacterium]